MRYLPKKLRRKIFERDNFTCVYCGARSYEEPLEIDHVIPRCKGGTDNENNLVTSCRRCNRLKGRRFPNHVMLEKAAEALNVTTAYLLRDTDNPSLEQSTLTLSNQVSHTRSQSNNEQSVNTGMFVYETKDGERFEAPPTEEGIKFIERMRPSVIDKVVHPVMA